MRSRIFYLLVVLAALGFTFLWVFLKYSGGPSGEQTVSEVIKTPEQIVEEDWISFSAPTDVTTPAFDIEMTVLKPIDRIDIVWTHPSSEQSELYSLKTFQPDTSEALYKISAALGNLLPGLNTYEIIGMKLPNGDPEQKFRAEFSLDFDLKNYTELNPRMFIFYPYPTETDSSSVALRGTLEAGVDKLQVYSFHPKVGQATFAILNKYVPLEKNFEYFMDEKLGNFERGENQYVIEALDESGSIVARKFFTVRSTKLTLEDKVKDLFGDLTMVKGGWYVSSALPWFSLRPVYESVWIPEEEGKVVLPRPTLLYTVESTLKTDLCEYLKSVDYEKENYSYKAYSYETCQKFRYGVSVFDRFLSVLEYQPFELIKRTDYKNVENTASSSFVMIETGGMQTDPSSLSFDDSSFSDPSKDPASNPDAPEKKYYLYQMLMTDEVPYVEKKIGEIAIEATADQQQKMNELKAFLNTYSGDELFSPLLFPPEPKESSEAAAE